MVRYSFVSIPAALAVGIVVILSSPYLALMALIGVLLAAITAITAIVWAAASAIYRRSRRVMERLLVRKGAAPANR